MTILVLDIGSSSVRALLFDEAIQVLAQAVRPHEFTTTPPGAATLEAADLQQRVEACMDEILQQPQAKDIRAVGMDTFVGNVIGIDAAGQAVTPLYAYADSRCAEDVAALTAQIDAEAAHQRTGCLLHTAYLPARLTWLHRTEPKMFTSVDQWVDLGAYLYRHWFGAAPISYSAAAWSGLLNRETLDWDDQWLDVLKLPKSRFPLLDDYSAGQHGLTTKYAQRWPALSDVPFFLAVGDGAAANVGSGCVEAGQIALSLGTTAALRIVSTEKLPAVPSGLWSYRIDQRHHLIGGATSEGGNIFAWARQTLALPKDAEDQLLRREPDGHGLTCLPLLAGERSPGWQADATGVIDGLRLSTAPLDMLQAVLEGVALRLAIIAAQLGGDHPVIASGGALKASPAWAQMIANALDRPLKLAEESEITARGAAILAVAALDGRDLSDFALPIAETVEPQPAAVKVLRSARERQVALYQKFYGKH